MQTKHLRLLVIGILGAITLLCFIQVSKYSEYYNGASDIVFHILFFFNDTTEWAPGYSEEAFKKVQIGSSQQEVLTLLGEPLEKETYADRQIWRYTTAPPDCNYWFRIIVFDKNEVVKYTKRKYFVD